MVTAIPEIADVPVGSPVRPRGVLAVAAPAPDGWELGGIQTSATCPSPVVANKCVSFEAVAGRPSVATFSAFMIEQGSGCSTLSGDRRAQEAREALSATTDYALGLTLRTGEANDSDDNLDAATDVGAFGDVLAALAALECAAAETGKGLEYVLHATPGAAVYLAEAGLIDSGGRSPAGALWIVSTGYACDDEGAQRIWATGRVWAAAGAIDVHESVDRRTNDREAWAVRSAIVGFNTCINLTATFAVVPEE